MNGIILLNKESGITSFCACKAVKKITGVRKAGHTGTLDPMATGVLPVFLDSATRFIELLPVKDKTYEARFITGRKTDTLDITGVVTEDTGKKAGLDEIINLLPRFRGEILQTPPMYSAVKKDGVRLYELARKGLDVQRDKRSVTVYGISVRQDESGEFVLNISCSSGTYIRSIIGDIGDILGCGAVMTALKRTSANEFKLSECRTVSELEALQKSGQLGSAVIELDQVLCTYPSVTVTEAQSIRFRNGGELFIDRLNIGSDNGLYRVYSPDGSFLGLGEILREKGILAVKKIYVAGK